MEYIYSKQMHAVLYWASMVRPSLACWHGMAQLDIIVYTEPTFGTGTNCARCAALGGQLIIRQLPVYSRSAACLRYLYMYAHVLLMVTCLSNNHTHLGSWYSMNRSFGTAAAHTKAFASAIHTIVLVGGLYL